MRRNSHRPIGASLNADLAAGKAIRGRGGLLRVRRRARDAKHGDKNGERCDDPVVYPVVDPFDFETTSRIAAEEIAGMRPTALQVAGAFHGWTVAAIWLDTAGQLVLRHGGMGGEARAEGEGAVAHLGVDDSCTGQQAATMTDLETTLCTVRAVGGRVYVEMASASWQVAFFALPVAYTPARHR